MFKHSEQPKAFAMRLLLALLLPFALAACGQPESQPMPPTVLAAASLQESLTAAAEAWQAQGHPAPVLSFAASSALARQIESGAPADIFISADQEWMDELAEQRLIRPDTRTDFLGNALALVGPADSDVTIEFAQGADLAGALGDGRLAMADPDAVPAGRYGREALESLGLWASVESRIARGDNVRAALALVERGEAPLGIVYATDARASTRVRLVATFPAASHPPIRYPIAVLAGATSPDAQAFRDFLVSDQGRTIFARYGFTP